MRFFEEGFDREATWQELKEEAACGAYTTIDELIEAYEDILELNREEEAFLEDEIDEALCRMETARQEEEKEAGQMVRRAKAEARELAAWLRTA